MPFLKIDNPPLNFNPEKFNDAISRIDNANSKDPNVEIVGDVSFPKELIYSDRMTSWLATIEPASSEALKLAVRCQHLRRWEVPRSGYPKGRVGYLKWRVALGKYHAECADDILTEVGYDREFINRVKILILKKNLKSDAESQCVEDVACLVFLESYFNEFAKSQNREKLVEIVRKTWRKMSSRGHAAALKLHLEPELRAIVEEAIEPCQD